MGFNYARIGYGSVQAMFEAFASPNVGERNQILGFFDFVKADPRAVAALRARDFTTFAKLYNGDGSWVETYAERLAEAFGSLGGLRIA